MNTLKQEALTAITQLPDTADVDTIMYSLYVIDKVMSCLQWVNAFNR
jgi:hypothetical protein